MVTSWWQCEHPHYAVTHNSNGTKPMKLIKNGTSVPSSDQLKAQAKRLRVAMAEKQTPITQSMALEAVARQWGYRDWNTLSAATKSDDLRGWSVGQPVAGTYLGHMFQGKLKAVRASNKPYNSRPLLNTGVSGEFRYLGVPSPSTRPPKPMHSPLTLRMGNMMRSRNLS